MAQLISRPRVSLPQSKKSEPGSGPGPAHSRPRRPHLTGTRRKKQKRSRFRRIGRFILASPRHLALAFVIGLGCGALASRAAGTIAPPYAAILGAIVVYPALFVIWRRVKGQ
jgi:hypothetical protein